MKSVLTCLLLCLLGSVVLAQGFYNLDFEYEAEKDQPRKWFIESEGRECSARLSQSEFHKGKHSLEISVRDGQVIAYLSLPAQMVSGRALQVQAFLKLIKADSMQVMLGLKDPSVSKPIIFPVDQKRTNTWMPALIQRKMSDYRSDRLLVAIVVAGTGKLFIDNVSIRIDEKNFIDIAPDLTEPKNETLTAIRKGAVDVSRSNQTGLATFSEMVGEARVVGLGENSHGSASVYTLKLAMVKELVQRKGFSTFALEAPAAEAEVINDYVLGAEIDKREVINNLVYPAWKTQEMLDIIEWIRKYNQTSARKLKFKGFDIQDAQTAMTKIEQLCNKLQVQSVAVDSIKNLLARREFAKQLKLLNNLDRQLETISGNSYDKQKLRQHIFILKQNSRMQNGDIDRDRGMAELIEYIVEESQEKVIVSADNSHITKSNFKMGFYLEQVYRSLYMNVGLTFGEGTYSAYGPNNPYDVHKPYVGTYEYLFMKTSLNDFLFDLRSNGSTFAGDTFLGFRSIGSRPQETTQFAEISLPMHFDVVGYINRSRHTKVLTE